eukprot:766417-Hanusia_phi.AAC.2
MCLNLSLLSFLHCGNEIPKALQHLLAGDNGDDARAEPYGNRLIESDPMIRRPINRAVTGCHSTTAPAV